MKPEIRQILGKTISGVIVKERNQAPKSQVFLLFSDNTFYELYGDYIAGTGAIDHGGKETVLSYMADGKVVVEAYETELRRRS